MPLALARSYSSSVSRLGFLSLKFKPCAWGPAVLGGLDSHWGVLSVLRSGLAGPSLRSAETKSWTWPGTRGWGDEPTQSNCLSLCEAKLLWDLPQPVKSEIAIYLGSWPHNGRGGGGFKGPSLPSHSCPTCLRIWHRNGFCFY